MRKRYLWAAALAAGIVATGLSGTAMGALTDMAGHWSAPLVAALESKGVIAGDLDGRYNPDAPLTRAQLAKIFVTGLGYEDEAQLLARYSSRYTDIPQWHWAKGYIESLAETGLTEGYPDGSFGPGDSVTRAQMAVFMVRAMGLSAEAQLSRLMPTGYQDDTAIPAWARGYIYVARSAGLMEGFPDGSFRPLQPVTKAEGGVTLLRLMARRGMAYHLSGTLVQFDPATGRGVVRDELGTERTFVMAPDAEYYRGGVAVKQDRISRADQVWIVLDKQQQGRFLEARYTDLLVDRAKLTGSTLHVTLPDGVERELVLQPGALIYLNGRPSSAAQLGTASPVYLVLDGESGTVRTVDAVRASMEGTVAGANPTSGRVFVMADKKLQTLELAPDALLFLNGNQVPVTYLRSGDRVRLAVNDAGLLTFLQAER